MLHIIPITLLVFVISKLEIHLLCRIVDYPFASENIHKHFSHSDGDFFLHVLVMTLKIKIFIVQV